MKSSRTWHCLTLCVLVGIVYLLFQPILGHAFLLADDEPTIYHNDGITQLSGAAFIKWSLTDIEASLRYKPLTWWALHGIWSVAGNNPAAFHATSLVLHLANTCLLYLILHAVFAAETKRGPGPWLVPAMITLAWAIHPLRAEPVAWAAQIAYPLATFFVLLAFHFYRRWRVSAGSSGELLAGYLFYLLALGTYPIVLTCGAVVIADRLLDRWLAPSVHSPPPRTIGLAGIGAIITPAVAILAYTLHGISNYEYDYWNGSIAEARTSWMQLAMATENLARFFWLELWPEPAGIFVGFNIQYVVSPVRIGGLLALLTGLGWCWSRLPDRVLRVRLLRLATYFVLVCLPVLGLTTANYLPSMKSHYLPGIVVAAGVCGLLLQIGPGRRQWLGLGVLTILLAASLPKFRTLLADHRDTNTYFLELERHAQRTPGFNLNLTWYLRARGAFQVGDHSTVAEYYGRLHPGLLPVPCLVEYAVAQYNNDAHADCARLVTMLAERTGQPGLLRLADDITQDPTNEKIKAALLHLCMLHRVAPY
jgi:hypothetical protein